jgi:transcription elongation factor GreA
VIAAIEEAREKGDLSENAEYDAAKEAQAQLTYRMQEIEDCLARLEVVGDHHIQDRGKVAFSATVTLADLATDEEKRFQIVGGHEADLQAGRISIQSPVASALIGKRAGDVAAVHTPKGLVEYEIKSIEYL